MSDHDSSTPDPDSAEGQAYRRDRAFARMVEAIEDFDRSSGDGSLIVDWVLVTSSHIDTGNGGSATAYGLWGPLELPAHRLIGLLEYGSHKARARVDASERGQGGEFGP